MSGIRMRREERPNLYMDKESRTFASKILEELGTIKRMLHNAISVPSSEHKESDHSQEKAHGSPHQISVKISNSILHRHQLQHPKTSPPIKRTDASSGRKNGNRSLR